MYVHLKEVLVELAYANGFILNDEDIPGWLESLPPMDDAILEEIDAFLGTLSPEERSIVADGEISEMEAILARTPLGPVIDAYLNFGFV